MPLWHYDFTIHKDIHARAAKTPIKAVTTVNFVVASFTIEMVIAAKAANDIISPETVNHIICWPTIQHIGSPVAVEVGTRLAILSKRHPDLA